MSMLAEMWNEGRDDLIREGQVIKLDYKDYFTQEEEERMRKALCFWSFLKSTLNLRFHAVSSWQDRKIQLEDFFNHSNQYIRLIARIETLPTTLWRALLQVENIDFQTGESFLRRITVSQHRAITDNYEDFFNDQIPRALDNRRRFKKITLEELKNEPLDSKRRYFASPAIGKEYRGLDMRFRKFPELGNDMPNSNYSHSQAFFSLSSVPDFVVREGGLYDRLFKMARRDYVFRPNNKPEIGRHICPGAWATAIILGLFFIVSPALFVTDLLGFLPENPVFGVPFALIGAVTPLWLCLAGFKFLAKKASKKFAVKIESFFEKVADWTSDQWIYHENAFKYIALLILVGLGIYVGCLLGSKLGNMIFLPYLATTAALYMFWQIHQRIQTGFSRDLKHFPLSLKILLGTLSAITLAIFVGQNYAIIIAILGLLWVFMPVILVFGLPIAGLGLFMNFIDRQDSKKVDRILQKMEKVSLFISVLIIGFALGTTAVIMVSFFLKASANPLTYFSWGMVFVCVYAIIFLCASEKTRKKRSFYKWVLANRNRYNMILQSQDFFQSNRWLEKQPEIIRYSFLDELEKIVKTHFRVEFSDLPFSLLDFGARINDVKLQEIKKWINSEDFKRFEDDETFRTTAILMSILRGDSYQEAIASGAKKLQRRRQRKKALEGALLPFEIFIFKPISVLVNGCRFLFQTVCPFVAERGEVTMTSKTGV